MAGHLELGREELEDRLRRFDLAVSLAHPGRSFRLVLVGGSAMVLLCCLSRSTADIDALDVPSDLAPLLEKYDINCRVTAYMNHFAHNLEDRLVALGLKTKAVECYSASLEDIVASKLYSPRSIDEFDVRRPEVVRAIDWERLDDVVKDMYQSRMNDHRYREFLWTYDKYRQECRPCDP